MAGREKERESVGEEQYQELEQTNERVNGLVFPQLGHVVAAQKTIEQQQRKKAQLNKRGSVLEFFWYARRLLQPRLVVRTRGLLQQHKLCCCPCYGFCDFVVLGLSLSTKAIYL